MARHKFGKTTRGCGLPAKKKTARGMRCVRICEGGRWSFVPGSECGMKPKEKSLGCGCSGSKK